MTWCNDEEDSDEEERRIGINNNETIITPSSNNNAHDPSKPITQIPSITCPSCGHNIQLPHQGGLINELPGLPAGVKFDPNDQEILEHLEAKVVSDVCKLHPLIDEFIPTLQGHNGICYTHPQRLPGVSKDGQIRHFFHRPSKAYTTGTRKRRKVDTDNEGSETRWHKTGKTRPVFAGGSVKGFKKILVLYTNYGRQRKPEKTNWVMHQYHLGSNEEEKDGELVVSKVFYQTQPRQCGSLINNVPHNNNKDIIINHDDQNQYDDHQRRRLVNNDDDGDDDDDDVMMMMPKESGLTNVEYYNNSPYMSYDHNSIIHRESSPPPQLIPNNLVVQGDHHHHGSSFIRFAMDANKSKLQRKL